MSPQQDQSPGLRLPQPSFDAGQAPSTGVPQPYQQTTPMPGIAPTLSVTAPDPTAMPQPAPYQSFDVPQGVHQQPASALQQPAGAISVPPANVPAQPFAAAAPLQDAPPLPSDDDSTLDQEWVAKARDIVSRTHSDPYLQSKEISKIKAQYIKVRYNKDIKTVEE